MQSNANPDLSIKGCSAILAGGRETRANQAIAYNNCGNAYYRKGEYDRSIVDLNRAIELDPQYAHAYNNLAWTYFEAGKAAEGLPDAERSLALRPDHAGTLNTRGHIFEALGRREEAIADYRRALSKDSTGQDSKDALPRLGAPSEPARCESGASYPCGLVRLIPIVLRRFSTETSLA